MKDPGPHVVALLTAILDKTCAALPSAAGYLTLKPILHPAIFYDDCEGTEPYIVTGTGDGYQASYVPEAALVGLTGLKVQTREAGAASGDLAQAHIHLPGNALPIIRVQMLIARPPPTSTNYATAIHLSADYGDYLYRSVVEINWQTPSVSYWKKANGFWSMTAIAGWLMEPANHRWHHLQLAINAQTGHYYEIKSDGRTHSIPLEQMEPIATANRGCQLELELRTRTCEAVQANTHFDQILVTAEAL